ncbi:MAG TPA: outer membrane protein transport protein [Leptospiraceae bacterium]|nr:outer membrane protein transport protein [Leptospiraceae bacterium]HMX34211.1 outer membrane protein transport protein [Leptospiraceae bacterium]HMY32924.1 outer membrane protein transport protein [Leptospiraceae bacterium]HMZ66063.1 outer membrane protein transport protein [Leptospiraceae bacterium]HNA08992.1 outer membrane protein transport protein [Leptospiraceae bacterium]
MIFSIQEVEADQVFQNIHSFLGERASGMGGAYTAVSDDATGTYYNPGGLGFANKSSFTASSSGYQKGYDNYTNADGTGRDYIRKSSSYFPNFLGYVGGGEKLKYGFSFVSPYQSQTDVANSITLPFQLYEGQYAYSNYVSINKEELIRTQFGLSLAYRLTDRLSIGATLYYVRETHVLFATDEYEKFDKTRMREIYYDRKLSIGFEPILGFVYALTDKLYLGFSTRKIINTAGRRNSYYSDENYFIYKSGFGSGGVDYTDSPFIQTKSNVSMPAPTEIRTGLSYYFSEKLLWVGDFIYTSPYKLSGQNYIVNFSNPLRITFGDDEYHELRRTETKNYATGLEYFVNQVFAIRIGYFTNHSSNKKIRWPQSVIESSIYEYASNRIAIDPANTIYYAGIRGGHYQYDFNDAYYQNDVSSRGITLGFSYYISRNTSVSITVIHQRGRGGSVYYFQAPSTPVLFLQDQVNFSITAMSE